MKEICMNSASFEDTGFHYTLSLISGKYKWSSSTA